MLEVRRRDDPADSHDAGGQGQGCRGARPWEGRDGGHRGLTTGDRQGLSVRPLPAGPEPALPAGLPATHPDRRLQLGDKPVVDSLRHLRLQLVEALVTVGESLVAGGKESQPSAAAGAPCPASHGRAAGRVSLTALVKGRGCKASRLHLRSLQTAQPHLTTHCLSAEPQGSPGVTLKGGSRWSSHSNHRGGGLAQPQRQPPPRFPTSSRVTLLPVWVGVPEKLWSLQAPCWAGLGQDMWPLGEFSCLLKGATEEGTDALSGGRDHIQVIRPAPGHHRGLWPEGRVYTLRRQNGRRERTGVSEDIVKLPKTPS